MSTHEGVSGLTPPAEILSALDASDLDRLIEIWTAGFPNTHPEDIQAYAPRIVSAENAEIVVARNSLGHIASSMVVCVAPGRDKIRGHIDDVATHPLHLRQGYAGRLLDFSIDWFQKREVKRVYLASSDDRQPAHALYLSRGFYIHDTNEFQLDL